MMVIFSIQDDKGKGLAAISTSFIPQGSLILAESPLLRFPASSRTALDWAGDLLKNMQQKLSPSQRQKFFRLANSWPSLKPIEGIIRTNALPLGAGAPHGGIFLTCSRFNHSCLSNATYTWQSHLEQEVIYAIKDIHVGEEVTVSYLLTDVWAATRQRRKSFLSTHFNFTCCCTSCSIHGEELRDDDEKRQRLGWCRQLAADLDLILEEPHQSLHSCKEALDLMAEIGAGSGHPERHTIYYDAFQICIAQQDVARAKAFLLLAREAAIAYQGPGNADDGRLLSLAQNPTAHSMYGLGRQWPSDEDEMLDPGDAGFERWLWERCHEHASDSD